jgi:Sulfatase-modifying factor enzyme 1
MSAQVSRADLLRALHLGHDRALALEHTEAVWWGYVMPAAQAAASASLVIQLPPAEVTTGASVEVSVSAPKARSPLRMPEAWVAERLNPKDTDEEGAEAAKQRPPLRPEDLQPPDEPNVRYQDLVPLPRLVRPLGVQLRQKRPGTVDVPALLRASAHRRWPRALPRNTRQVWPQALVVLLDFSVELFPYRHDMYRVAGLLRARVPKAQLQVRVGWHGPHGRWESLADDALQHDDERLQSQPWETYLIVSDFGLLRPASGLHQSWRAWLAQAQQRQCRCVALAPIAADAVDAELAALVQVLRWSPDSRWAPERGQPKGIGSSDKASDELDALHELLACLAATLRMDPPLLRALRQHSSAAQDASLEGRLWAHPDVSATNYATLRHDALSSRPHETAAPSRSLWDALHKQAADHHAHWPLGMKVVDDMQQLAVTLAPPLELLPSTRNALHRLADRLHSAQGDSAVFANTADYVLRRVPAQARPLLGPALDALAQAAGRPTGSQQRWCLLQRGEQLCIAPATKSRAPGPGAVLCSDLGQAATGELVRIAQPLQPPQYLALPARGLLALPAMKAGAGIVLGGEETQLLRRRRIRGVWGWAQSDAGLIETLDLPWSKDMSFPPRRGLARGAALLPDLNGEEVAVMVGRDEYGIFLAMQPQALIRKGLPADAFIRFRYLEPATYLQGSPQGTGHDDEHPQHPVTLSQGLWLAETPCTQALWLVVMGNNSSYFKQSAEAPRRPVENVSWDDVQTFLKALQPLLPPGCKAVLPTESQWEYACSAGTQTEYWWSDKPDDARVNWNNQRKATTPVDRYPPNPWGLYDMHGNVWEWCADGLRDYADSTERDPEGPGDREFRVARGGSWFDRPGVARAASRFRRHRGFADQFLGFRFALRSPSGPEPLRRVADDASTPE